MPKIDTVQVLKKVRNVAVTGVVLLVLVVGVGVAYTWYVGQDEATNTAAIPEPVDAASAPAITPTKPAADAKQSAAVQMLSSPIAPGDNASIMVKTNATSECTITVEYNDVPSTDSGLKPKKADDFGIVSWTWSVEETVPVGKWPVDVVCAYNDQTAMVRGNLVVEIPKQ